MEPHPRTPARPHGLRPLGLPHPVQVRPDPLGHPLEVTRTRRGGQRSTLNVAQVDEAWRIAEEWWREAPLARTYFQVRAEDGRALTLFHDDTQPSDHGWYEQGY